MLTRRESTKMLMGIIGASLSGLPESLRVAGPTQSGRGRRVNAITGSRVQVIIRHMLTGMDNKEGTLV